MAPPLAWLQVGPGLVGAPEAGGVQVGGAGMALEHLGPGSAAADLTEQGAGRVVPDLLVGDGLEELTGPAI